MQKRILYQALEQVKRFLFVDKLSTPYLTTEKVAV